MRANFFNTDMLLRVPACELINKTPDYLGQETCTSGLLLKTDEIENRVYELEIGIQ